VSVLGIDIGGTRLKAGRVDESGRIEASRTAPTPGDRDSLRATLDSLIGELGGASVNGVGIGCKGIINPATTRVEVLPGTLAYLEGAVLRDLVPAGMRVAADNDARVAMAGELMWGAAKGRANALMLTLGTGVGGAIVADGRLLRGATGVAGHIGHLTVDPDGPVCICGNHGCLETFFSARAIESEAFAVVHRGCASRLAGNPTCADVFRAAAEGDAIARGIIGRATRALGAALAGLLHILDPEVVIVGGQISEAGEALFEALKQEVRWRTRRLLRREVPIVPPRVADPSGIIGAAALVR
jgi:glucokinase